MPDYSLEIRMMAEGCAAVCGVDEAGRGPLAGPVYAAAVILPLGLEIAGLDDSKKLSSKKRAELDAVIRTAAISYGIASADHNDIDRFNILGATMAAMKAAVDMLSPPPDFALIDGNIARGFGNLPLMTVKGGDGMSASIAAASVLAKVARDRYMEMMDALYPQYGFAVHKGYPTAAHYERLAEFGPSPIHRMSFLRKWREGAR